MSNCANCKYRRGPGRLPGDLANHFQEWMDTFEEFHELTPDEIEDLMRLATNDNRFEE